MSTFIGRLVLLGSSLALGACGGDPSAAWDPPTTPERPEPSPSAEGRRPGPAQARPASVEEAMRRVPVTMYMTTWCPVCQRARGWLETGGYEFTEFDVETNPRAGRILRSLNPRGTIPMFDVDGRILIGFEPTMLKDTIRTAAEERYGR